MTDYCTTVCHSSCRHPTIGEAYQCARKRLADSGQYSLDKPTYATGGASVFSLKHCDGSELTQAELEELERVRRRWANTH